MSINVRQFGFLSPSDLATIITPRSEELVGRGEGDVHHMTDLTQQKNTTGRGSHTISNGPTDAATAARRRLIATNKPPTRILLPGIDPMTSTNNTPYHQRKLVLNDVTASSSSPRKDASSGVSSQREVDGPIPSPPWGQQHVPTSVQVIEDMPEADMGPTMTITARRGEVEEKVDDHVATTKTTGARVPLPPAPYSPRTDARIKPRTLKRYTTSTQRGEFHQNRLIGMALRKRLSATDGALADVLVRSPNSTVAKSTTMPSSKSANTYLRITHRPANAGGTLHRMDARAEELEVAGFEALSVNAPPLEGGGVGGGESYLIANRTKDAPVKPGFTLPTIQKPGHPPQGAEAGSVIDRSNALLTTLLSSTGGTQKGKFEDGERLTLELPPIGASPLSSSPRHRGGSTVSMGVLREREVGAVAARKEVAALAARAAAQLGLVEAMSSLATPKEVLPSRCAYASLHPLELIKELPTSLGETSSAAQPSDRGLAPQGGGGGGGLACANLGWELFLDNLHPTTISTTTTATAKSTRVSPKRSQVGDGTIPSSVKVTQPSTARQPHRPPQPRPNKTEGASHSARAPPTTSPETTHQQLWSWSALERLAMAQAQSEGTTRARCLPGRNAAVSEEAALRRAQLDREAVQLAQQEATGGTLTANERRRRTTILASRNPSRLTEDNDDDGAGRVSDLGARSTALANLALYEADPTLFSVLGEDTCVVEFPTFPFASDRETAAFRILQEAQHGSNNNGSLSVGQGSGAKKIEDAEAEKKRLERAVMARYLYTNREAFDQQDKPSDDWRVWKRSAGAVAAASASPVVPRVRHGRGQNSQAHSNTEAEEEPVLAPSEVLDKVDLEDRLTVLWQVSQRTPRNMESFIQTQLRAGRDAAKDAEEEVKPYPANRLI